MEVKVLVCGSRDFFDYRKMYEVLSGFSSARIIAGACRGADMLAVRIAKELGFSYCEYPANWQKYGRLAGSVRNWHMLQTECPDVVIAFPLGVSRGTWDMVKKAKSEGVAVRVIESN